jgi:hypothetical protein
MKTHIKMIVGMLRYHATRMNVLVNLLLAGASEPLLTELGLCGMWRTISPAGDSEVFVD